MVAEVVWWQTGLRHGCESAERGRRTGEVHTGLCVYPVRKIKNRFSKTRRNLRLVGGVQRSQPIEGSREGRARRSELRGGEPSWNG